MIPAIQTHTIQVNQLVNLWACQTQRLMKHSILHKNMKQVIHRWIKSHFATTKKIFKECSSVTRDQNNIAITFLARHKNRRKKMHIQDTKTLNSKRSWFIKNWKKLRKRRKGRQSRISRILKRLKSAKYSSNGKKTKSWIKREHQNRLQIY